MSDEIKKENPNAATPGTPEDAPAPPVSSEQPAPPSSPPQPSAPPQGGAEPQGTAPPQGVALPQGGAEPQGAASPQDVPPQGGAEPQGGDQGGTPPQGGALPPAGALPHGTLPPPTPTPPVARDGGFGRFVRNRAVQIAGAGLVGIFIGGGAVATGVAVSGNDGDSRWADRSGFSREWRAPADQGDPFSGWQQPGQLNLDQGDSSNLTPSTPS